MNESLITYETALKASSLGFKGPIGLGIEYNLGQYYNNEGVLNGDCSDGIFQTINYHMALKRGETPEPVSSKAVAAPTQSLLQRWIRETRGVHIAIHRNACGYYWSMCKSSNGTDLGWMDFMKYPGPNEGGVWDTYEESLEHALKTQLSLDLPENSSSIGGSWKSYVTAALKQK